MSRITTADRVRALLSGLSKDLGTVGLAPDLDVRDLRAARWLNGSTSVPHSFLGGFGSNGFVLSLIWANPSSADCPRSSWLHNLSDEEDLDDAALTDLASTVQVWAMDELGRGWPERHDGRGRFLGLLEPVVTDGVGTWRLRGTPMAKIGTLDPASVK